MGAPELAIAYISIAPKVDGFARQLREQIIGPAEDAGEQAGEEASENFGEKLRKGVAAAAIAAGAVMAKALADAVGQANVTSTLQAQLGATSKNAGRYGKVAGKLYTSGVAESFDAGADAIRATMQSGIAPAGATNKQLQSIATKASDVATVFDQDLGGVTNAVAQMIRTGLAKNASQAFDILDKGFQNGANKADDLLDTFNEYGTQFRKLGIDGPHALGLISQAIRGGARDSDLAADALKEFSIRAVDGSATTAAGFKAIGLNASNMATRIGKGGKSASAALDLTLDKLRGIKDPVARSAAAVNLFGTQAEDLGNALYDMNLDSAATGLGNLAGTADRVGKAIRSGPTYELQVFIRTVQQKLISAAAQLIPPITAVGHAINSASGTLQSIGNVISTLSPWLASLATMVIGLTVALNAQAAITATVTAVTKAWAVAQGILNAVMSLNPIVLVVIAIASLVAGIVVAYNKFAWFRNIVQSVFGFISKAVRILLTVAITPMVASFLLVAATGRWLWSNVLKPVFGWIASAALRMYRIGIKPAVDMTRIAFGWVSTAAHRLYDTAIRPVFKVISDLAHKLWINGIKPPFDAIRAAAGKVADSFRSNVAAIKTAWNKIEGIAKKPVAFVINTVYNNGIRRVWNKVAEAFGAPTLNPFHPKGFSAGGIEPGYTPGRDTHLAAVSGGEAIMRPEWTRAVGPGYVYGMNALAKRGGISAVRNALPGFANGGIFGWVGKALQGAGGKAWDIAKRGASWLRDTLADSARAGFKRIVDPLLRHIPGSSTEYGKAIRGIPNKIIDTVLGYSKTADTKLIKLGIGGKGFTSALRWARTQAGKPYQWGGNGNPSWDCSGFTSAIESVIRGERPHRRWTTFGFNGTSAPAGWVRGLRSPYMVGVTNAGVGHVAGTLNGVNVESRGGAGVLVGGSARGYRDRLFRDWYGFKYDSGGWLAPGVTYNGTDRPEPVLTATQWADISSLAARGAEPGLQPGDRLILTVDGRTQLEAYVDRRADARIDQGLVSPARLGRRA